MKNNLLFIAFFMSCSFAAQTQNIDSLSQQYEEQSIQLAAFKDSLEVYTKRVEDFTGKVAQLKDKITPYPRWDKGLFGTLGLNVTDYNNWLSKEAPSINSINIGTTFNAFLKLEERHFYWQNSANLTLGWLKFDDKNDPNDNDSLQVATDAFQLSSLLGYKISKKLALSALVEYRTSLLDGKFNNPGYLDLGSAGVTWKPQANFVLVAHLLNYNIVFAEDGFDYESSLGAKLVAEYSRKFPKGIGWRSNLSAFLSYKDFNALSNWTWVNSFTTAYKGIGIGLDIGLRNSKQEALALELTDNPLQTYWVLGLSYSL